MKLSERRPLLRRLPRRWSAFLLLGLVLVISSCSSIVTGEGWPGLTVVPNNDGNGGYAYVTWQSQVFQVNLAPMPNPASSLSRFMMWRTDLPNNTHTYSVPVLSPDGSTLYVGAYDKKVYALDTHGNLLGTFNPAPTNERIIGDGMIVNNTLYIGMGDQGIRGYDLKTGEDRGSFTGTQFGVAAKPVADPAGKILYVTSLDHFLYALDLTNKLNLLWKVDLGGAIEATPLLLDNILYAGTFGNQLLAVSTESHQVIAKYDTEGWIWSTPVVYTNPDTNATSLFVGDLSGYLYSFDISDVKNGNFKLNWHVIDTDHPGAIRGAVAVAKNVKRSDTETVNEVITGSESGYVRYYNADSGAVIQTSGIKTEDKILGDLHLVGNYVIFTTLSNNQLVMAFDVRSGAAMSWAVSLDESKNYLPTLTAQPAPTQVPQTLSTSSATTVPTQAR